MTLCSTKRASSVRRLTAGPLLRAPLPPRCSAPFLLREPLRSCQGGPHHLHTAAPIKSVHVLRDAAGAILLLLQHGGRGASSRPASRVSRLLKGLQFWPIVPLDCAPLPLLQRTPINSRIRRLGGCGFGCRWRQPVPQGDPTPGWILSGQRWSGSRETPS